MFVVSTLTLPTWQGGHASFHSDEWHCDSVAFLQGRRRVMCAYAEFRDRWFGEVSVFEMQVNVQLVPLEQMTELSLMFSWSPCNTSVTQLDSWTATLHTIECFFFSTHDWFFSSSAHFCMTERLNMPNQFSEGCRCLCAMRPWLEIQRRFFLQNEHNLFFFTRLTITIPFRCDHNIFHKIRAINS